MTRLIRLIILFTGICGLNSWSQFPGNQKTDQKADSIKALIQTSKTDTARLKQINNLSEYYYQIKDSINLKNNTDKAIDLVIKARKSGNPDVVNKVLVQYSEALINTSRYFYLKNKNDSSEYYCIQAINLSDSIHYDNGIIKSCMLLGQIYRMKSLYEKGIICLDKGIEVAARAGDKYNESELLNLKGVMYQNLDLHEKSLEVFDLAENIKKSLNDTEGLMRVAVNKAIAYSRMGRVAEAKELYLEQVKYYEKKGDKKLLADALGRVGANLSLQGQYDTACVYHLRSHQLYNEINDTYGIALSSNYLGIVKKETGDFDSAMYYFKNALALFISLDHKQKTGSTYFNVANIYLRWGQYDPALQNYVQALKYFELASSKKGIANCYSSIGIIYAQTKDYQKAEEYSLKSIELDQKYKLRNELPSDYQQLGEIYWYMKKYDEAISFLNKSVSAYRSVEDTVRMTSALMVLGKIEAELKHYENAEKYFLQCLNTDSTAGAKYNEVKSRISIADLYMDMSESGNSLQGKPALLENAKFHLDKSLLLAQQMNATDVLIEIYKELSRLERMQNNSAMSLTYFAKSTELKDSLFSIDKARQLKELELKYETEKKDKEIALLNSQNEINLLKYREQESKLLTSQIESERKQNEIKLLNKTNELQELYLTQTKQAVIRKESETRAKESELALASIDIQLKREQLEKQSLIRNGILAGSGLLILVSVLIIRSIQLRRKLEKQVAVTNERKRISLDLHDDIGSGLSKISLLSELLKKETLSPQAKSEAGKISETTHEISQNMSEIIWALNSNNDYLENLITYIRRYAGEFFDNLSLNIKIIAPHQIPKIPISGEMRRNIFFTIKEALNNIVKHANASEACLKFEYDNNILKVTISDNGKGISPDLNQYGNGLKNMRHRIDSINGEINFENQNGTKIHLKLPIPAKLP